MRLGVIACLVFIALGFGLLFGAMENRPLIDEDVETSMETMMSASQIIEEGDWGNTLTLLAAPLDFFGSLIGVVWSAFNNPLFYAGGWWAIVPYFALSPLVIVCITGLIILLIGILSKSI